MSNQIKSYNVWGLGPALWTHSSVQWENPGIGGSSGTPWTLT